MWSVTIVSLLLIGGLQQLSLTLTFDSLLFVLLENLKIPYSTVLLFLSLVTIALGIVAIFLAPIIDANHNVNMVLWASGCSLMARSGCLAMLIIERSFGTWHYVVLTVLYIFNFVADVTFVSQLISLILKRYIEGTYSTISTNIYQERFSDQVFAVQYSVGNISGFIGALCYDTFRTYAPTVQEANVATQGYALLVNMGILGLLLVSRTFFFASELVRPAPSLTRHLTGTSPTSLAHKIFVTAPIRWIKGFYSVLGQPSFRRYAAFSLVLLGVSTIFRHIDQTMPIVLQRLYNPRIHFALVEGINALGVGLLTVPIQWLTSKYRSYNVIMVGTIISSLSVLIVVIPNSHASNTDALFVDYIPYILFVAVYSIGEATWSGRLTSYMLRSAPKQSRAMYQALAHLLQLGARLISTWHATWLVGHYCPSNVHCEPQRMWAIIWGVGAITPFLLIVFTRWLRMSTQ